MPPKKYWDAFALYALLSCNAKPVLLKNDNHLQPRLFAKSTVYIPDDSPNDVDYRENYSSDFRSFLSSYGSLFFPSLVKSSQPNFQLYFKTEVSIIFTIFFNSGYLLARCYPSCLSGTGIRAKNESPRFSTE
jgi:hypothetical protein